MREINSVSSSLHEKPKLKICQVEAPKYVESFNLSVLSLLYRL